MYNLVIDIGNTFSKVALFNSHERIKLQSFNQLNPLVISQFVAGYTVNNAIISAVKFDIGELEKYVSQEFNYLRFSTSVASSIHNHYKTPATLGLDRYAAIIGAACLFPDKSCLVIDAGTCITYDFVDKDKNYFGGSISPGIAMRYKAMHSFTGRLPLIDFDSLNTMEHGEDTPTSIITGVQQGVVYEVKGFIENYLTKYPDTIVALCGGDCNFFDTRLKNSIFAPIVKAIPDLVLIGLNEVIHQYND